MYAIGDCGGAVSASNCPDCGVRIGGSGYRLHAGNEHFAGMDGSNRSAWDNAVMENNMM